MLEEEEVLEEQQEEVDLYIVFSIAENLFCVNCSYINGIMQLQEYTPVPDAPREVRGIMKNRNEVITLFDVRAALNLGFLQEAYQDFCNMIDERKRDHERWVQALENTALNNAPFTMATDSHKCALGKWRDSFTSDINRVNSLLNRLDAPHAGLHHSALEILELWEDGDTPANRKAIMAIYTHVKKVFMPAVLSILEEVKQTFRDSVFREMVITLNTRESRGIIVENIHSVESLYDVSNESGSDQFINSDYIRSVKRSDRIHGLILEIAPIELIQMIAGYEPPQM